MGSGIKGLLSDGRDRLMRGVLQAVAEFEADLIALEAQTRLR